MWTVKEAADYFKVKQVTFIRRINRGKVKAIKIGSAWRIPDEEIERIKKGGC